MQPAASAPNGLDRADERRPLIEARGLVKQFGGLARGRRHVDRARRGRDARADRPERRRQDHALQPARRQPASRRRHDHRSPAQDLSRRGPEARIALRRRPHLPDPAAVRRDDGAGERADRRPASGGRAHLDEFPAARPRRRARRRRRSRRRARCSISSRCRRSKASRRGCCRAASASCSSWRAS